MNNDLKPGEDNPSNENEKTQKANPPSVGPAVDESQKERQEDIDWRNWLGDRFTDKLEHIRQSVSQLFEDHKNIPPLKGFTPHEDVHCRAVEELMHRLIPGLCYRGLREYERFLLLASAWLHDIGMIRGLFQGRDKSVSDEEIRAAHHLRSEEFVVNHPARCGVEEMDAAILGVLVRLHGTPLDEVPSSLDACGEKIRVRLLAAYLCLADALHIDSTRAPSDLYAICLAYNVPVSTKIHWIKSRFVSGVGINAETRQIVFQFKVPSSFQEKELQKQGVDVAKFSRIHDVVIQETTRYLNAVKTELLKGGISYFLTIERQTVPMLLDEQVLRDLKQIVNNPDFMANPSSSRLTQLMVRTVADILNLDEFGMPIENNLSQSELITRRKRVLDVLRDIEDGVLVERSCHIELKRLVDGLRRVTETAIQDLQTLGTPGKYSQFAPADSAVHLKRSPDVLETYVSEQLRQNEKVRRLIRVTAKHYFELFAQMLSPSNNETPNVTAALSWEQIPVHPVTIVLFGYSELVIKSLCGFRDAILAGLLTKYLANYNNWGTQETSVSRAEKSIDLNANLPFHLAELERIASNHFRLFVCTGEPKTQINATGQLSFHDGSQYVEALHEHGFTDIEIITDITAVGNLLHRTWTGRSTMDPADGTVARDPMVDLVMLGVNGIEDNRFRHGTGHLGISAAVAALHGIYSNTNRFTRLPRLVFVATQKKYRANRSNTENGYDESDNLANKWSWINGKRLIEKEGYWIQPGFCSEAVREKVFLIKDQKFQQSFHEKQICLYNPREEDVWNALVDDLILDEKFFYGKNRSDQTSPGISQMDIREGDIFIRRSDGIMEKIQGSKSGNLGDIFKTTEGLKVPQKESAE
jgi:hypothetical protein